MIASDVISKARLALSDVDGDRWSDTRLLSLLNDALSDVATKSRLFHRRTYLKILDNITHYTIQDIAHKIIRVEFNNRVLPIISHEDIDAGAVIGVPKINAADNWKDDTGIEPTHIIYDKADNTNFTIYPRIENANFDHIVSPEYYGLITGLYYEDLQVVPATNLGDLSPPDIKQYLYIYYIAKHAEVTLLADTLDIKDEHKAMLANFVTAAALLDNIDAQNREMSKDYFALYNNSLETLNKNNTTNFTASRPAVQYKGFE